MKCMKAFLLGLATVVASGFAGEGDHFLDIAPGIAFVGHSDLKQPAYGTSLGYLWGINEWTDLEAVGDFYIAQSSHDGVDNYLSGSLGLRSYFTPYFGDIRPMFGLGLALAYQKQEDEGIDNALFKASFHARILYDASDRIKVFSEFEPNIQLGSDLHGDFVIHLGAQIRLGS